MDFGFGGGVAGAFDKEEDCSFGCEGFGGVGFLMSLFLLFLAASNTFVTSVSSSTSSGINGNGIDFLTGFGCSTASGGIDSGISIFDSES